MNKKTLELNNPIVKWIAKNKLTIDQFAKIVGANKQTIRDIIKKQSPCTSVWICIKIKQITNLKPESYLLDIEDYKKLIKRK